jgi:hypothetical protein
MSFSCSSFAYKINCVLRCLSIAAVVGSLCVPIAIHRKDGKSTGSRSFEELS